MTSRFWSSQLEARLADRAVRVLAGIGLVLFAAYPIRVFLFGPAISWLFKGFWAVLLASSVLRPTWGAAALVATVPLVPALPFLHPSIPHGIVHLIVLSQALPLLARRAAGRRQSASDPAGWALGLFVAVGVVSASAYYAGYRVGFDSVAAFARELHGHLSRYMLWRPGPDIENVLVALSTIGDGFLTYLVVRSAVPANRVPALACLAGGVSFVVAGFGVYQRMTGAGLRPTWLSYDPGIVRINATYWDPNAVASYFAMMIPVACGLAGAAAATRVTTAPESRPAQMAGRRLAWLSGAALLALALIMTAGRMAYVAAVIGCCVLGAGAIRCGLDRNDASRLVRHHFRRALLAAASVVVVGVVMLTLVGTVRNVRHQDQNSYLETVLYTLNLRASLDERLKGRQALWRTSGLMIRDSPAFGIGLGRFYREFISYNETVGGFEPGMRLSAHNTFLNIAAEMGVVGLVSWLAVLGLIYAAAFRRLGRGEATPVTWLRVGLGAGLVAFSVTMITGDRTILREDVVMFSVVAGLAIGLAPGAPALRQAARAVAVAAGLMLVLAWPIRMVAAARQVRLERITWGLHFPEQVPGGPRFRWTTDRAIFHVPGSARSLALPLRSVAPFGQTVTIRLDDRVVDAVELKDHAWHTLRYVLPRKKHPPRYYRVELQVQPTWQAPADERTLGVMLGEYGWIQ